MKAITYLRVSTKSQGQSGLGLDAQREIIERFLASRDGETMKEYVDIISGAKTQRDMLQTAISHAKSIGAVLVIAKLDRISRKVSFISSLMEAGIEFKVAEMPDATKFQLHLYAALAEEERRLISERTKCALKAAKSRGVKLGSAASALSQANKHKALVFALTVRDHIIPLREDGMAYKEIADVLNTNGILARSGSKWHAMTVARAYTRLNAVGG